MHKYFVSLLVVFSTLFSSTVYGQWVKTGIIGDGKCIVDALAMSGKNLCAGTYGRGLYFSNNNGESWTAASGIGPTFAVTTLGVSGTNIFAGSVYMHGLFLSTNGGNSWTESDSGIPSTCFISSFGVNGTDIFVGTGLTHAIYRSTTNGATWTIADSGIPSMVGIYPYTSTLTAFSNGAGGNNLLSANGKIYLSTNNGTTWNEATSSNSPNVVTDVTSFAVTPKSGGTNIFAGTNHNGIFLSTDNGANWAMVDSGIPESPSGGLCSVTSLVAYGNNLFAATNVGIFFSNSNGVIWKSISDTLVNCSLALDDSGTTLFAACGVTVWRMPLSSLPVINHSISMTHEQPAIHIYNAKDAATIAYTLSSSCIVKLNVYSLAGKKMTQLVQELQSSGSHSVSLSKSQIPEGMCVCEFTAGNYHENHTFMLLK